jgi:hypothetical protein
MRASLEPAARCGRCCERSGKKHSSACHAALCTLFGAAALSCLPCSGSIRGVWAAGRSSLCVSVHAETKKDGWRLGCYAVECLMLCGCVVLSFVHAPVRQAVVCCCVCSSTAALPAAGMLVDCCAHTAKHLAASRWLVHCLQCRHEHAELVITLLLPIAFFGARCCPASPGPACVVGKR